jgi:hypothetical protein
MKVKLTRDLLVGKVDHKPGDVVEVDDTRGRDIVAKGDGEIVGGYDGPPIRPYGVSTGSPTVVPPPELTGEVLPVAPRPGEVVTKVGAKETVKVTVAQPNEATVEVPASVETDGEVKVPDGIVPNAKPGDEVVVTEPGVPAQHVVKAPEPKADPKKK